MGFKIDNNKIADEVEPQFVLAADDSKNIFGPNSSGIDASDIAKSEGKPGSRQRKRTKKLVVPLRRKRRKVTSPLMMDSETTTSSLPMAPLRDLTLLPTRAALRT